MFSCKSNLEFIASNDVLYVDGTFKSTPKYFYQLFTIHGLRNEHYIPLVFFLLPSKHTSSYEEAFKHLLVEAVKINVNIQPKIIYADLEISIHNAVKSVWSDSKVKICRFHLGQSWWRKIQSLGLNNPYEETDSEVCKF